MLTAWEDQGPGASVTFAGALVRPLSVQEVPRQPAEEEPSPPDLDQGLAGLHVALVVFGHSPVANHPLYLESRVG